MNGDLLLDTSAVVEFFDDDPTAQGLVTAAAGLYISAITLGELLFGAERSDRRAENIAHISTFASTLSSVLSCNAVTAEHYGDLRNTLQKKGKPIPVNDVWIAAVARQYDLTVVTKDRHFQEVPGISVFSW